MSYIKFIAVAVVMSMAMAPVAHAQDEDCDDAARTETLEDDCVLVPPPAGGLGATNLAILVPLVGVGLLAAIGAGGNGGGTNNTTTGQ